MLVNRAAARLRRAGRLRRVDAAPPGARAPFAAELPFDLGWALLVEGDLEGAVSALRAAVRYAPGDAEARIALSWALRAGHPEEADEQWRAAAALDPTLEPLRLRGPPKARLERVLPSEAALVIDTLRAAEARAGAGAR